MLEERQDQQDHFKNVLVMVVGQAFNAAGYELAHEPLKWIAGQYRFVNPNLSQGARGTLEFQVLVTTETEHAPRTPSRFRVTLKRDEAEPKRRTLSALVVADFGVAILPSADHWWTFHDTDSLGKALGEAGHLIVGYGLPWLNGELTPGD